LRTTAIIVNIIANILWLVLSVFNLIARLVFHAFSKKDHHWDGWKEIFSVSFNYFPLIALMAIIAGWILFARREYGWSLFATLFPFINVIVCMATLFAVVAS
jgi:small-conductance mechanosensitive channel